MDLMQKLLSAPFEFVRDYGGPFIIVLSLLVFVHEWGHYIVARLCGVKIVNFSIGFGKELFGWTDKRGCRWKFSLIPLGGYVQMFGDSDPASARHADGVTDGDRIREYTAEEKKVAFYTQSVAKRAAIVFAGPAINYIFAIILLTGLYAFDGQPYTPPIAAQVMEGSAAAKAGIQPDDKIIRADGRAIERFSDLRQVVMVSLDREITLEILRSTGEMGQWSDTPVTIKVTPERIVETDRFGFKHSTGRMGIVSPSSSFAMQEHNIFSAFVAATGETFRITGDTLRSIGQMIMGIRSADELGGILRIGAYAGDFAQQGLLAFITFTALLSVNLGLINLLPIPMLDGGHLTMYAMETVRGKPLSERVQEYALRVGVVFLLSIMVFATWNDLVQLKVFDNVAKLFS